MKSSLETAIAGAKLGPLPCFGAPRVAGIAGLFAALVLPAGGNPTGPVVRRGTATFANQGPTLTIRTSDQTFIDWRSFNIGLGEQTTFLEPSASSVAWNRINDPNPSQILGTLNANGLIVLQNSAGFFVGGQAAITARGLVMTTAPICPPDFASGAWQFNSPPPAAKVINYGQISAGPGGSIFLIARDVENDGSITAPGGNIGLYAGKQVLVSERPDGLGLSAQVRLPQGSVDNQGRLLADAGTIALHAQVVNQGGLVQANSVREHNGVIELVASDTLNLADSSTITAKGGTQGPSPGGQVLLKSDHLFNDAAASSLSVGGGSQGGQGGQVEISAPQMAAIQSQLDSRSAPGWTGGRLVIDPYNITLAAGGNSASSGTVGQGDPPTEPGSTLTLDPSSFSGFSQISLQAANNITLARNTHWTLGDSSEPGNTLTLQAGNNITLNSYSDITAGKNWSVTMVAGADFASPTSVTANKGGIYLNQYSYVQTQNGRLSLFAGKEVLVRGGAVRTMGGGNIAVEAVAGDVNAGSNPNGYIFDNTTSSGYHVDEANLGGISTGAGGDVTIQAGRNVVSFFPTPADAVQGDAGSGAFGPEPGVVTVTAGGSVYGHFVAADSQRNGQLVASTITALTGDVGGNPGATTGSQGNPLALSLVKGGWEVTAPNGNIYLQEVRNPNGIFDNFAAATPTWHGFDYDPRAFVTLAAANGVYLLGQGLPRPNDHVPIVYPPSLTIQAGAGGVVLGNSLILFPSPFGEFNLTTTGGGSLQTDSPGTVHDLTMSDSARTQWTGGDDLGNTDHAATPVQLNNPNPVVLNISGNVLDLNITTPKQTRITVGGEMDNTSFVGQNLHPTDVTSLDVAGRIWNRNDYTFATLSQGLLPIVAYPTAVPDYLEVLRDAVLSDGTLAFPSFNFTYNPTTRQFGYRGVMTPEVEQLLLGPLHVISYGPDGQPLLDSEGNYVTHTAAFGVDPAVISGLYSASQNIPTERPLGYQVGGPGQFKVTAASLDLGVTHGLISAGPFLNPALASMPGADIHVDLQGDLDMFSSTIGSFFGGSISIYAGGAIHVGLQALLSTAGYARGIYTSGHGDVSVIARGTIDVEGSRIAAYNGGNVLVESLQGNVNAGSGASTQVPVTEITVDPATGVPTVKYQPIVGSGILATTLPDAPPGEVVGNLTVQAPRGDIVASHGGIVQDPLNGNRSLTPTLTLSAGTRDAAGKVVYAGNIDASDSGVIGVNTKLDAAGNITGLVVARGNSDISAAANVSGTFFAAGMANLAVGGTVSGTVIGIAGISAAAGKVDASMLSQNVNVNNARADSGLASSATATAVSSSATQSNQEETMKQAAGAQPESSSDEDMKKRQDKRPVLRKTVGRVTVVLPGP